MVIVENESKKMMKMASKLQLKSSFPKLNPQFLTARFISQLFVSRLSFYTTDDKLQELFSPFGQITDARLVMDPDTGRTKGFGFVTFEDEADARNAINALNGRIVDGRLIFVEFAGRAN